MITRRGAFASLAGLIAAGLVGCSTAGTPSGGVEDARDGDAPILPEPRAITVALTASGDSNPGPTGKAAPVTLRLYTLRSVGRFQTLDYFELAEGGTSALAGAVVDSRVVSLRPGQTRNVTLNAGTDGAYLGAAAAYRDIDGSRWRGQVSLVGRETFAVRVGRAAVSVSGS